MYCKVIELIQSKDEGQNVFLHSLGIVSPHQSATSILVLWVETQEHKYPEIMKEEAILGDEIVLDHSMPGSKVGDYSGPQN